MNLNVPSNLGKLLALVVLVLAIVFGVLETDPISVEESALIGILALAVMLD